jgi:hypothetical protein
MLDASVLGKHTLQQVLERACVPFAIPKVEYGLTSVWVLFNPNKA